MHFALLLAEFIACTYLAAESIFLVAIRCFFECAVVSAFIEGFVFFFEWLAIESIFCIAQTPSGKLSHSVNISLLNL